MEMTSLDDVAMSNLRILGTGYSRKTRLLIDGHILQEMETDDETYDQMFSLKDLEYPVLFSFFRGKWMFDRAGRLKRRELLDLMDYSLDTLYEMIRETDEPEEVWITFKKLACSLEDLHSEMDESHLQKTLCHRTVERFANYMESQFDGFVAMLADSKKYLYLTPETIDLTESDSDREDVEEEDGEDREETNKDQ
tara:strand:- start:202 stop:786 length:585 start_codon:yes stop_codon:yes gene_type:complete